MCVTFHVKSIKRMLLLLQKGGALSRFVVAPLSDDAHFFVDHYCELVIVHLRLREHFWLILDLDDLKSPVIA